MTGGECQAPEGLVVRGRQPPEFVPLRDQHTEKIINTFERTDAEAVVYQGGGADATLAANDRARRTSAATATRRSGGLRLRAIGVRGVETESSRTLGNAR